MASKFPKKKSRENELRTRKGHDMTWSCDKHGEPIKLYCVQHSISICHVCATKNHQKPCKLDDIEDVIFQRRVNFYDKKPKIEETKKQLKTLVPKIETVRANASRSIDVVEDQVKMTFEDKLKNVRDKKVRMLREIDEEADEEIRIINEKREKRIKDCNTEIEKEEKFLKYNEAKLLSDTKTISEVVTKKTNNLTGKNQHAINTLMNIESTIKRINQHDETLVNEAPQVLASIDDNLSLNVHQEVSDCLNRIQIEVERVKFVEGEVGGEYYGRIDGYIGKWELVKSIHIPSVVKLPRVCGFISEDEICVRGEINKDTHDTNINTQHTEKVIDEGVLITSCAPIDSNVIVCGKVRDDCTGDRLDGCITLYDRQWKVIRDISIPRNGHASYCSVYVDVDGDGMIIAAQFNQSNIYVINPADDKIVNTITMQGKKVWGEIQALSSGDIVWKTYYDKYTVISRSGEEKSAIHCNEWGLFSECRVDKLTDTLYISYWDRARKTCAVDQVSRGGVIQARRIVEYVKSDRPYYSSPCLVTPSGYLVGCDGDKLHLYKNTFIL
ncbi:uncharacterized protein LOC121416448 [Lytechinus variegatus]|uniref:uncharacterized protein LOC121416448 n=1 Tax=Lytechinus variegatus TaxID=7654 RepID=UPI001BB11F59|nr:uncharacterized protein LOC121416448 [Lytechinus variegatus]